MQTVMDNTPNTVYEAYETMLDRGEDHDQARKLLQIILVARRPLTVQEMNIALNVEEEHKSYADVELDPEDTFPSIVRNLCGLFISIVDSKVYIIHQTAREFLIDRGPNLRPNSRPTNDGTLWQHSMEVSESEFVMAKLCLVYLMFTEFETMPLVTNVQDRSRELYMYDEQVDKYVSGYHFLDYAAHNWFHHFGSASNQKKLFLRPMWLRVCDTNSSRFLTISNIAYVNRLFEGHASSPELKNLWLAVNFGHEDMVEYLIQEGAQLNFPDRLGRTPLHWATRKGDPLLVRIFISNGVDISLKDCWGHTALWNAVRENRVEIAQILISNGANVLERGEGLARKDQTLLSQVAHRIGYIEGQAPFDSNRRSVEGVRPPPLQYLNGEDGDWLELMKTLIGAGVEIDAKDEDDSTPLMIAAYGGNQEAVQLLVESGANVNAESKNGTPLLQAASMNRHKVMQYLRNKGAWDDEDAVKKHLGSSMPPPPPTPPPLPPSSIYDYTYSEKNYDDSGKWIYQYGK